LEKNDAIAANPSRVLGKLRAARANGAEIRGARAACALLLTGRMKRALLLLVLLAACGGPADQTCKPMPCATPCPGVGYKVDAHGCRVSCECNGTPTTSCPALSCGGSCGLGNATDSFGCPTCACCNPADCQPGGCNSTGDDGCPTCVAC